MRLPVCRDWRYLSAHPPDVVTIPESYTLYPTLQSSVVDCEFPTRNARHENVCNMHHITDSINCCVCCHPIYSGRQVCDVPVGVALEEGHTGFLIHLPSAVLALTFLARRIQPFLSLVDREVEFCVLTNQPFSTCWAFLFLFFL